MLEQMIKEIKAYVSDMLIPHDIKEIEHCKKYDREYCSVTDCLLCVADEFIKIAEKYKAKENKWISVSEMPEHCGLSVLLAVKNNFEQIRVIHAFTNYLREGKFMFLTGEKEYSENNSGYIRDCWKPVAWMPLPKYTKED